MKNDRRVKKRFDEEVRRHAKNTKLDYRVDRIYPVNILRLVRSSSVQTLFGRKKLVFKVVEDEQLGTVAAKTEFTTGTVTITCKHCVETRALVGVGRDRMTLAHELGHAVMHSGDAAFREVDAAGATSISAVTPSESAEHQAKVFAAAFLIHDEDAAKMRSAQEISEQFGVSLRAAEICFDRLMRKADREQAAERVRKSADEAMALLKGKPAIQSAYLSEPCASCHAIALIPLGLKVLCDNCGFVGDRFQDGDKQT
jgi:hypothetical protein